MHNSQMRIVLVGLVFLGFLLTPCSGWSGTEEPEGNIANNKLRLVMKSQLVSLACQVAKEAEDAEAEDDCDFLKANLFTFVNIEEKLSPLEDASGKYPLALFIFVGTEERETPWLDVKIPSQSTMGYLAIYGGIPMLIMRNTYQAKLVNGLVMLREVNHARRVFYRPRGSSPLTRHEKRLADVHAFKFEFRLMDKIGGKKYTALVDAEVQRSLESDLPLTAKKSAKLRLTQTRAITDIFKTSEADEIDFLLSQFLKEVKFKEVDRFTSDGTLADEIKADLDY